jgi:isochorismate synthase
VKRIRKRIAQLLEVNQPFVIYRKPNKNTIYFIFQTDDLTYKALNFTDEGFVFAPFNDKEASLFIPYSKAERLTFENENVEEGFQKKFIEKSLIKEKLSHLDLVKKGIDFIQNSVAKKIVLSRKETLKEENFSIEKIFHNLNQPFIFCMLSGAS